MTEVNERAIYQAVHDAIASMTPEQIRDLTLDPWRELAGLTRVD